MDQALISGLGNIYVDEILYQCRLHPEKSTGDISRKQQEMLFKNMKAVLKTAIRKKADPDQLPGTYLIPHRKEDEKCPKCDGKIKKIRVNNRGTYFCPECQHK